MSPKVEVESSIGALSERVDVLSGQIAALMVYVARILPQVSEQDARSMQGLAQQLAPNQVLGIGAQIAQRSASQGLERIRSIAQSLGAIRLAGQDKKA
jgi:hypothetical protein